MMSLVMQEQSRTGTGSPAQYSDAKQVQALKREQEQLITRIQMQLKQLTTSALPTQTAGQKVAGPEMWLY